MSQPLDIDKVSDTGDYQVEEDEIEDNVQEEGEKELEIIDHKKVLHDVKDISSKVTKPYLTKYERARLIGFRAVQLANGAIPTVPVENLRNVMDIATKELEEKRLPLIVRRRFPDGTYEDWSIDQF